MPKTKTQTPAERIAAIKQADAAARTERLELDQATLTDLIAAAAEAEAPVKRVEACCADLVSDLTTGALKMQGTSMSDRLRNIITVAEADLANVAAAVQEA